MPKRLSKPLVAIATGTLVCAGIGTYVWHESVRSPLFELHIFDTPGAPSIFIRTPSDKRILIGGGGSADIIRGITTLLPFYSRRIDMVIVPASDAAHVTGLVEVLSRYSIGKIIIPSITLVTLGLATSSDPTYEVFLNMARAAHIPMDEAGAGMHIILDAQSSVRTQPHPTFIDMLFPVSPEDFAYSVASGPGMVFRISYRTTSVLIMGAVSPKIQKFIASASSSQVTTIPQKTDAIVFYETASSGAISLAALRAFDPEYFILKQSASRVKTSAAAVQKKPDILAGFMADHRFYINDDGGVTITSDGASVRIKKGP